MTQTRHDVTSNAAVELHNVRKAFVGVEVLKGIDLEVGRGSVTCLIGPSGSGKSTLLRCINGLESYDAGVIRVNGALIGRSVDKRGRLHEVGARQINAQRQQIGMVFQQFNLFQHMSVMENLIEAPIQVGRVKRKAAVDRARELLAQVGLEDRVDAYPRQLSGGQQQRVAIARALATNPSVMLFDEPTSALDPELVGEVLEVMAQLAESGMTMLVVTHEMRFARSAATQVVLLDGGRVVESGTPQAVLDNPQEERTVRFLSRMH